MREADQLPGLSIKYRLLVLSIKLLAAKGHGSGHRCLACTIATWHVQNCAGDCVKYGQRGRCNVCVECNATEFLASADM